MAHTQNKTNDELYKLIRHKNIINQKKAQRLSWFGYLHQIPEERMVRSSNKGNSKSSSSSSSKKRNNNSSKKATATASVESETATAIKK